MPTGSPQAAMLRRLGARVGSDTPGTRPGTNRSFQISENMPDIAASVLEPPAGSVVREAHPAAQDLGSALTCRSCRISSSSEGLQIFAGHLSTDSLNYCGFSRSPCRKVGKGPLRLRLI